MSHESREKHAQKSPYAVEYARVGSGLRITFTMPEPFPSESRTLSPLFLYMLASRLALDVLSACSRAILDRRAEVSVLDLNGVSYAPRQ